jgi:hypothetical protein
MKKTWIFMVNVFLTVTKKNFKKMLTLITDHETKLGAQSSDPPILALHSRTVPVKIDYVDKYDKWVAAKGAYEGETRRFEQMLDELVDEKIPAWDILVLNEFPENTPDYKVIFPDGRTAFRYGSYEMRIGRVASLAENLKTYPVFSELRTEVLAYHQLLLTTRATQQTKEQLVDNASGVLELARISAGEIMFANLGALMDIFHQTPELLSQFFSLEDIRRHTSQPESYSFLINPDTTLDSGIDFDEYTTFRFTNTGPVTVCVFTAPTADTPCPETAKTVAPGQEVVYLAGELGDSANTFLLLTNKDTLKIAELEVLVSD